MTDSPRVKLHFQSATAGSSSQSYRMQRTGGFRDGQSIPVFGPDRRVHWRVFVVGGGVLV